MKTTAYKHHNLAHNSQAYQLLILAQRSNKPEDYKALDRHLQQLDLNHRKLTT